jgi:hypothetical protein
MELRAPQPVVLRDCVDALWRQNRRARPAEMPQSADPSDNPASLLERELRPPPLIDDLAGHAPGIGGRAGLVDLLPVRGQFLLVLDVSSPSSSRRSSSWSSKL